MLSWFRTSKKDQFVERQNVEAVHNITDSEQVGNKGDVVQNVYPEKQTTTTDCGVQAQPETRVVDPKVVEFFKCFPDPYREQAIERYSKPEGFLRISIYKQYQMREEMRHAKEGIFLQDLRKEKREKELEAQQKQREKLQEQLKERSESGVREWYEDWPVLRDLPLQEGDTMQHKLAFTALFSLSSTTVVAVAVHDRLKARTMTLPWFGLSFLSGAAGFYGAAARLNNWFPYDYNLDTTWEDKFKMWSDRMENHVKALHKDISDKISRKDP